MATRSSGDRCAQRVLLRTGSVVHHSQIAYTPASVRLYSLVVNRSSSVAWIAREGVGAYRIGLLDPKTRRDAVQVNGELNEACRRVGEGPDTQPRSLRLTGRGAGVTWLDDRHERSAMFER
jgi:hypothetical protein